MPERTIHTEALRAGRPLRVGSATLLPVERVVVRGGRGDRCAWLSAAKEPYALVVRDVGGMRAVAAADATPLSLEELRQRVPGLDAALAST